MTMQIELVLHNALYLQIKKWSPPKNWCNSRA